MVTHVPFIKKKNYLVTVSDYPKLLGDINWTRTYLTFITAELKPLFNVLQGNSDPASENSLIPEAGRALVKVTDAISRVMEIGLIQVRCGCFFACLLLQLRLLYLCNQDP